MMTTKVSRRILARLTVMLMRQAAVVTVRVSGGLVRIVRRASESGKRGGQPLERQQ